MSTTAQALVYCAEMNCRWAGACPLHGQCPECGSRQIRLLDENEAEGGGVCAEVGSVAHAPADSSALSARVKLTIVGPRLRFEWSANVEPTELRPHRYLRVGAARTFAEAKADVEETFRKVLGTGHVLAWSEIDERNEVTAKGCVTR